MGMIWLPEGSTEPRALNEIVRRPEACVGKDKEVDGHQFQCAAGIRIGCWAGSRQGKDSRQLRWLSLQRRLRRIALLRHIRRSLVAARTESQYKCEKKPWTEEELSHGDSLK